MRSISENAASAAIVIAEPFSEKGQPARSDYSVAIAASPDAHKLDGKMVDGKRTAGPLVKRLTESAVSAVMTFTEPFSEKGQQSERASGTPNAVPPWDLRLGPALAPSRCDVHARTCALTRVPSSPAVDKGQPPT